MTNRLFLVGIVVGLLGALGLAPLFSTLPGQSSAQMMAGSHMGNNMMTDFQTTGQNAPWHTTNHASFSASGTSYVENVQVSGISISGDKQVTVNIRYTGNDTAPNIVVIARSEPMMNGASDGTMVGGHMHSGMMMGGMDTIGAMPAGQGMIYGDQYLAWNSTQWQEWHMQMAELHAKMNSTQINGLHQMHNMISNQNMMMGPGMMSGPQMFMWNKTSTATFSHQPLVGSTVLESGWSPSATLRVTLVGDGSAYEINGASVMVYPLTS
jgi:hypothetical protein